MICSESRYRDEALGCDGVPAEAISWLSNLDRQLAKNSVIYPLEIAGTKVVFRIDGLIMNLWFLHQADERRYSHGGYRPNVEART